LEPAAQRKELLPTGTRRQFTRFLPIVEREFVHRIRTRKRIMQLGVAF
jgi:hypothetical protein